MMCDACVVNGEELKPALHRILSDEQVEYLHIHNAEPGCFMCAVGRIE